jgi:hypothetical protein
VPPIYQPEIAANAVLWAARHYRREYIVGFPAWKGIHGSYLFPSFTDRYLAKNGYKSQQTAEPESKDQQDNLFESVNGNFGAHGRFDSSARSTDLFFELTKRVPIPTLVLFICLVIAIVIAVIF